MTGARKNDNTYYRNLMGKTRDKLSVVLQEMRKRCYNPNRRSYKDYGGRGITVCEEWNTNNPPRSGFHRFKDFVLSIHPNVYELIEKGYTIERINNDGNYEPGNIRFASPQEQANNRRSTIYVEFRGEKMSFMDAYVLSRSKVSWETSRKRLMKYGWKDMEEIFNTPPVRTRRKGSRV